MTIEETKERIAVMQAYVDGKQIQWERSDGKWGYVPEPSWSINENFRVKPEPKYRPFKDAEECWQEMLKHEPFGWLREKKRNVYTQIGFMHTEGIQGTSGGSSNYKAFFDCFSFADGAPFGVKED